MQILLKMERTDVPESTELKDFLLKAKHVEALHSLSRMPVVSTQRVVSDRAVLSSESFPEEEEEERAEEEEEEEDDVRSIVANFGKP